LGDGRENDVGTGATDMDLMAEHRRRDESDDHFPSGFVEQPDTSPFGAPVLCTWMGHPVIFDANMLCPS